MAGSERRALQGIMRERYAVHHQLLGSDNRDDKDERQPPDSSDDPVDKKLNKKPPSGHVDTKPGEVW
jgi:hypothetical protein